MLDNFQKFDKRLIDRNLRNGEITEKKYKDFLDSLEEVKNFKKLNEEEILRKVGITRVTAEKNK